jgi:tetratricopeptide (TPR) repeat protein
MSRLAALTIVLSIALALGASPVRADPRTDCYRLSGDAAIQACTEAIARNPGDALSYVNRAYEHLQKGDHARSIADYSKAIELDPKRWDAWQGRAWVYFRAGKAAEGLADADASLKLQPDAAQALDTRGHILEALGRREEAIADFRRALSLEPRLAGSRRGLRRLGASP